MEESRPQLGANTGRRLRLLLSQSIRGVQRSFQDLKKDYERYLALARAEVQNGNAVAAENYSQHAEHYFRSMVSDTEETY